MQPIEIRQNKWKWIPMLTLLLVVQIVVFYLVYFSGQYDGNTLVKMMHVFLTLGWLYAIYIPVKKLIKNEPFLILSKSDLTIYEKGKPVSYLWIQIKDWHIEKDKENSSRYLILETSEGKKSVNISWLEKKPNEIEALINEYKNVDRGTASSNKAQ